MIVYQATKKEFQSEIEGGDIENTILQLIKLKLHHSTADKEKDSWRNSLQYMYTVLNDDQIPSDSGVTIECQIPQTSKRIDFIISGKDELARENVVIIELKQWTEAQLTMKDGIVKTLLGKGYHETAHPSYQAWSYAALMNDFNETVRDDGIILTPCAFLHNYSNDDNTIRHPFYKEHLDKAPVFLKKDIVKLREFIKTYVRYGDKGQIMYRIDHGKISPSKHLSESLVSMIRGNREFILIDDQKLTYETALHKIAEAKKTDKKVLIVQGGPGTGKSVVAVNLLVEVTKRGLLTQYVTKNAAPRAVYQSKLTGTLSKTRFGNMFQSSGKYVETGSNTFDALIIDEAHRLNMKSGIYQNYGENQIKELIYAAKCAVFFIDEDQRVTLKDIGTKEEIFKWARYYNAEVTELELASQFRCNGSDGYLAWLDNLLQIRQTANLSIEEIDFDFRIVSTPCDLRDLIFERNKLNNHSRLVAGYCWDWVSKNDKSRMDIVFPEYDFAMRWNLTEDGSLWILKEGSVNEIGCIHTCQGLELDYVGVIVGPDLVVRNGIVQVDPGKRSRMDASVKGYKNLLKQNPEKGKEMMRSLIKNTYRTLFTRGMKGCYVYFTDKETEEYFRAHS